MKKKLLIIIPVCFILAVTLFWEPIFSSAIEWYLKGYCQKNMGGDLKVGRIFKTGHTWIIDKPQIDKVLKAEQVAITYKLHPLKRQVDLDINIINPQIQLDQVEKENLSAFIQSSLYTGKIKTKMTIQDGVLSSKDKDVYFYLNIDWSEQQNIGKVVVKLDNQLTQNNVFKLDLFRCAGYLCAGDFEFHNVNCNDVSHLVKDLGYDLDGWETEDGIIDGKIKVFFPKRGRPRLEGNVSLKRLIFHNATNDVQGVIQAAKLHLKQNRFERGKGLFIPSTIGQLDITEGASISFNRKGVPFWEIKNIHGGIDFHDSNVAKVNIKGVCTHDQRKFSLFITGDAQFFDESQAAVDLSCRVTSSDNNEAVARFVARQLGALYNCAEIELKNIGQKEFAFVKEVLGRSFPIWEQIHLNGGTIDASGIAFLEGYRFTDINIDYLVVRRLEFDLDPWELSCKIGRTSGNFSIKLSDDNPFESLDANFSINDGHLSVLGFGNQRLDFVDVQTDLSIQKGVIQKSVLEGEFAGMRGSVTLDWRKPEELIHFNFRGDTHHIVNMLPQMIKNGIKKKISKDHLTITADVNRTPTGAKVAGKINLVEPHSDQIESIAFGFELEKSSEKLWKRWPVNQIVRSYWENVGYESLRKVLPAIASPLALLKANWMKRESGIAGFVMRNGWFEATDLPVEKYVAPLIFPNDQMKLIGRGNFKGFFDHKRMDVAYSGRDVSLENTNFVIETKKIKKAEHYFDFDQGIHYGTILLHKASFFEKNSGLLFTDVDSLVTTEGCKIHFTDTKICCNGVTFTGRLDVDYDYPDGTYDIEIRSDTMAGKVSDVQHLFYHFDDSLYIMNLPLEGILSCENQSGYLRLVFHPDNYEMDASVQATLKEGAMTFEDLDVSLQDIAFQLDFNLGENRLAFTDIHGSILVDKDEYILSGEQIDFVDFANNEAKFDVWVGDKKRDVIRLVGRTVSRPKNRVEFVLDHQLTHFGDVHPTRFQLVFDQEGDVDAFDLELNYKLDTLLRDLQRFSRTGLLFLTDNMVKGFNDIKTAKGEFNLHLRYDPDNVQYLYRINGENITIGDHEIQKFLLNGKKKENQWVIDQCQLDDISITTQLNYDSESWNIPHLEIRCGKSFSMQLEGKYIEESETLQANVGLLQLDLEKLHEWPSLQTFVETCEPKGIVRASGVMTCDFNGRVRVETTLNASLKNLELKGLRFDDAEDISCHFVSDRGITFQNLNTVLRSVQTHIALDTASYEFVNEELHLKNLDFKIPYYNLSRVTTLLSQSFPDIITYKVANIMRSVKSEGHVEGRLNVEYSSSDIALNLALNEGTYKFYNMEHPLKDFVLEYDLDEFKITSQYRYEPFPFWLMIKSSSPNIDSGEIMISDKEQSSEQLLVKWEIDPHYGFLIRNVGGSFVGLTPNLVLDHEIPLSYQTIHLTGDVKIDARKTANLLPKELKEKVLYWKLGDGYYLSGKWTLFEDASVHYSGLLEGKDFELYGYHFDTLSAYLEYTPDAIRIHDLTIVDPAGTLHTNMIDMYVTDEEYWFVSMPLLTAEKFRPSLLRYPGTPIPRRVKPLVVKQFELQDFKGYLADSSTFRGHGEFNFSNRSKKMLQNTIFHIPGEILSRIGLDLAVLTPVTGTVHYNVEDGKFVLARVKNVYSEGRLSKFYLPKTPNTSYMDFYGNLHVQVRMKQYNLIFKLAELFTVNIQGTLQKPTYSLQRQRDKEVTSRE